MERKKTLLLVIVLIFAACNLFASISYSPSVCGYCGSVFTFPTADYLKTSPMGPLPKMRTSICAGSDLMLLTVGINRMEIGLGFSCMFNSRSLAAGINYLQSYYGFGIASGFDYHFTEKFSLCLKGRYMFCRYGALNNRFDCIEAELQPTYSIIESGISKTSLIAPICISYKSDSISLKVGVGIDFRMDISLGKSHEE